MTYNSTRNADLPDHALTLPLDARPDHVVILNGEVSGEVAIYRPSRLEMVEGDFHG